MEFKELLILMALSLLALLWVFPAYTVFMGSLKSLDDVIGSPSFTPPREVDLTTLFKVLNDMREPLVNTLIVTIPVALLATFIGSLTAYAVYRRFDRVSDIAIVLIAVSTYIPYQVLLIPFINIIKGIERYLDLTLFDTLPGLALGLATYYTPMASLLMTIFITVIPKDYIESALVDGAGEFKIFRRVVLPLLGPGLVSTFIFILILSWNNFFIPLILTRGYDKHVALKIFSYVGQSGTLYNEMFAAALIGSIPPLVLFILLGRYFIRGLLALGTGGVR